MPAAELDKIGTPAPLLPARLRKLIEQDILILLAGQAAELLYAEPSSRYVSAADCELAANNLACRASTLSSREQALHAEHVSKGDTGRFEHDDDSAAKLAWWLTGASAGFYLAWLCQLTAEIMSSPRFGRLVHALAEELLEYETLGARRVRQILQTVDTRVVVKTKGLR